MVSLNQLTKMINLIKIYFLKELNHFKTNPKDIIVENVSEIAELSGK